MKYDRYDWSMLTVSWIAIIIATIGFNLSIIGAIIAGFVLGGASSFAAESARLYMSSITNKS